MKVKNESRRTRLFQSRNNSWNINHGLFNIYNIVDNRKPMNLAYIGKITNIEPIPDADFIASATVYCDGGGQWIGIIKKTDFQVGDLCEVYIQDALFPAIDRFSFMESRKWRVKIARFKGAPSECVIMQTTELTANKLIGDNIEHIYGITKYERQIDSDGDIIADFPSNIPKTDEPNFQQVPRMIEALSGKEFYATIKYDGSSATVYYNNGLHCCSRKCELKPGTNVWKIAEYYNLERKLNGTTFAPQFEMIGPGVAKNNPLRLKKPEMRLFQIYDFKKHEYLDFDEFVKVANQFDLPTVDVCATGIFSLDDNALREMSNQKYQNGATAEGIVVRPIKETRILGERLSFKVINPLYKD